MEYNYRKRDERGFNEQCEYSHIPLNKTSLSKGERIEMLILKHASHSFAYFFLWNEFNYISSKRERISLHSLTHTHVFKFRSTLFFSSMKSVNRWKTHSDVLLGYNLRRPFRSGVCVFSQRLPFVFIKVVSLLFRSWMLFIMDQY